MARTPFSDSVLTTNLSDYVLVVPDAVCQVFDRAAGTPVTVYDLESGGTGVTSFTADSQGSFLVWIDLAGSGKYVLRVTPPGGSPKDTPFDVAVSGGGGSGSGAVTFLDVAPSAAGGLLAPVAKIRRISGGIFHDFSTGAPGTPIVGEEPGCPHWITNVTVTGTGSLTYDNTVHLAGIPQWAKMTSTSGSTASFTFTKETVPDKANSFNSFYFKRHGNTPNVRIASFTGQTGSLVDKAVNLRCNSGGVLAVTDSSSVVQGDSGAFALAQDVVYRIETNIVCNLDRTAIVTVRIYLGHGTVPVSSFVVPAFIVGQEIQSATLGLQNGANLGVNNYIVIGAPGVNADNWIGPYLGIPNSLEIVDQAGRRLLSSGPNGDLVGTVKVPYQIGDGGTEHYLYQEGDPIWRINDRGIFMGASVFGDPHDLQDDDLHDLTFDIQNRRMSCRGFNIRNLQDPPDLNFQAQDIWNTITGYGASGTGASTTANNPIVTFSDYSALRARNRGHGILLQVPPGTFTVTIASPAVFTKVGHGLALGDQVALTTTGALPTGLSVGPTYYVSATGLTANTFQLSTSFANALAGTSINTSGAQSGVHTITPDGKSYNIAEVLGPSSCTLTPVPPSTFNGLTWKLKVFPYPDPMFFKGIGKGGTLGQLRFSPWAHRFIRSGAAGALTGCTTVSGSADIVFGASSPLTADDVGRRLLVNDDGSLGALSPGRVLKITAVNTGTNTATVDHTVPASLSNVKWSLAGKDTDGYAIKSNKILMTMVGDAGVDTCNFGVGSLGCVNISFNGIIQDEYADNAYISPTLFRICANGWHESLIGGIDAKGFRVNGTTYRPHDGLHLGSRGLVAETCRPSGCAAASTPPNQVIVAGLVACVKGDPVSNVQVCVEVAGVGTPPAGRIELAFISANGTVRATTGNVAADAQWTSTGIKTFALTVPYTPTLGGAHFLAILKDGAFSVTDVQLARPTTLASALKAATGGVRGAFRQSGRTTYPGVCTMADAQANELFWLGCN